MSLDGFRLSTLREKLRSQAVEEEKKVEEKEVEKKINKGRRLNK